MSDREHPATRDDVSIRVAGVDDVDAVIGIGVDTYREHFSHIWSPHGLDAYLARDFDRYEVARQLGSDDTRYLLAERAGSVLGFSKMRYPRPPLVPIEGVIPAGGIELQKIYFRAAAVGQGIGTQLLLATIALAATLPTEPLWLCVLHRNPRARALYERHGFLVAGDHAIPTDLAAEPMWIMHRPR